MNKKQLPSALNIGSNGFGSAIEVNPMSPPPPPPNLKLSLKMPTKSEIKTDIDNFFANMPNEIPTINVGDYRFVKNLERGNFGSARLVQKDGSYFVCKIIILSKYEKYENSDIAIEHIKNETINYFRVSELCPSFCKFFGYEYDSINYVLYILMDNCGIDLINYFENNKINLTRLTLKQTDTVKNIILQVANALKCLHDNNYIHYDIKPENISIVESGDDIIVKLIDAGSLTFLDDSYGISYGTEGYMHPSLFQNRINMKRDMFLKKADIYSLLVFIFRFTEFANMYRDKTTGINKLANVNNIDELIHILKEPLSVGIIPPPPPVMSISNKGGIKSRRQTKRRRGTPFGSK